MVVVVVGVAKGVWEVIIGENEFRVGSSSRSQNDLAVIWPKF